MKYVYTILKEVEHDFGDPDGVLKLQHCLYAYDGGGTDYGYRFIWQPLKSEKGEHKRVLSIAAVKTLIEKAKREKWEECVSDLVVYNFITPSGERSKEQATRCHIETVGGTVLEETARVVEGLTKELSD